MARATKKKVLWEEQGRTANQQELGTVGRPDGTHGFCPTLSMERPIPCEVDTEPKHGGFKR